MSFTATHVVIVILLICLVGTSSPSPDVTTARVGNESLSAYEVLARYNFPVGLLPQGVYRYELNRTTGKFRAYLNGTCSFSLEGSYSLKYKSTISGYISQNRLTNLDGISVKVLFFWLNIVEVTRKGNELEFSVGIASTNFPIDNFYECPRCGCGLNCVNSHTEKRLVSKLRTNPFFSSS